MAASNMTNPTGEEILQYLLEAGEAQYPVEVKWGKGYRNVVIFQGKKYQYKGTGNVNKRLLKSILPLYISMSDKPSNKNTKTSTNNFDVKLKFETFIINLKSIFLRNNKVVIVKIRNLKRLFLDVYRNIFR